MVCRYIKPVVALFFCLIILSGSGQQVRNAPAMPEPDPLYPPFNLKVDPGSLIVSWLEPRMLMLGEDFEGVQFPPPGWQMLTLGKGWIQTDTPFVMRWEVPPGQGYFALANDDSASWNNNGAYDYLVLPMLNLTVADSFCLSFDAYFDGAFYHRATVEYSTDQAMSWQECDTVKGALSWARKRVDLTSLSGPGGLDSLLIAFHSDDNGHRASGFAVDNVIVYSNQEPAGLLNYIVWLDGNIVDTVEDTHYQLPFLRYGEEHSIAVQAAYLSGTSDTCHTIFLSRYLVPPDSLTASINWYDDIRLDWDPPEEPNPLAPFCLQFSFPSPNLFFEGGCESDGDWIYLVSANGGLVCKLDIEGNIQELFMIPGVPGLLDLAYDNNYMFGSNGTNTVYQMDFQTHTLVSQFTAPVNVRAIAYDPDWDAFWANSWSTDLTLFDKLGNMLTSFPVGNYGNYSGLAHDRWTDGGPYLWAFSQDSTGNLIVQIHIPTGQETGLTLDVTPLSISGGTSGGLYTQASPARPWVVTLGGNIRNDVSFGLYMYCSGPNYPDGLLGYNIYRDEQAIGYNDYWRTWYEYPFPDPYPCHYSFFVDAVYDMGPYGYPGDTLLSGKEGPAFLDTLWGNELDFYEDWTWGGFQTNQWTADDRWYVLGYGNPGKAAIFKGSPNMAGYSSSLTSYPLYSTQDSNCMIIFTYDIKLENENLTGEEFLDVEFWEEDSREWCSLRRYANDTSWNGFYTDSISLTSLAMGRYFMIRFRANGSQSSDIDSWIIDNISVYRHCLSPENLMAVLTPDQERIELTWDHPQPGYQQWKHWDDSIQHTGLGYGFHTWMHAAVRWDSLQLREYLGSAIVAVNMIPTNPVTFYIIEIWSGDSAETLVYQKPLSNYTIDEWNLVTIDPPLLLDVSRELWVGYAYFAKTDFPVSVDQGPPVDGYGNWLKSPWQGWQTILEINPDVPYNHNIQVLLTKEKTELEGYEVYRSIEEGPFGKVAVPEEEFFSDTVTIWNQAWCYKVTAICNTGTDTVRSGYSNTECVVPVALDELLLEKGLIVYPNPAQDHFTITSKGKVSNVMVYDATGKIISEYTINGKQATIRVDGWKPGLYHLSVVTGAGVEYYKLVVIR